MKDLTALLNGAIDMHVHAYPDVSLKHPQHRSNKQEIEECRAVGMAGLVLKTHGWPCVGLAHQLNAEYDDFTVYPSVSLNAMAGGPHPWVVEMALEMGAKVIWLPTWSAASDHDHNGFYEIAGKYLPRTKTELTSKDYYCLLDENGFLTDEIKECITLCRDGKAVLCTGHISAEESLAVGRFAKEIHYTNVCLTHPRAGCSFNEFEQIIEFARMGHYVEFCTLNVAPLYSNITIAEIKKLIDTVGPDHCYLSTDQFFDWTPSIPQQIYQVLGCLSEAGLSYEKLKTLMETPSRILNS